MSSLIGWAHTVIPAAKRKFGANCLDLRQTARVTMHLVTSNLVENWSVRSDCILVFNHVSEMTNLAVLLLLTLYQQWYTKLMLSVTVIWPGDVKSESTNTPSLTQLTLRYFWDHTKMVNFQARKKWPPFRSDIFKHMSCTKSFAFLLKFHWSFFPLSLIRVMACRQTSDKASPEPMLTKIYGVSRPQFALTQRG